jgi:polyferredoxin
MARSPRRATSITPVIATWLFLRLLRWLAWIGFFAFSIYFLLDRAPHIDSFGQLRHATEAMMFGPGLLAVFVGFLELMMRERAGIVRPSFGQLIPPRAEQLQHSTHQR